MSFIKERNQHTYLYRITNLVNGKDYVGIAVDYKSRWKDHIRDSKKPPCDSECLTAKAFRKYGIENFQFEVLAIARTFDLAGHLERMARILGMGAYNRTGGGEGGFNPSPETRQKLSDAAKARWTDPEYKARVSAKIREVWSNPELREQQSDMVVEFWASGEWKQWRAQKTQEMWADPETREKIMKAQLEAVQDPVHRARQSEGSLKMWARPGFKEEQSVRMRQAWEALSEEDKKAHAEKSKATWENPVFRALMEKQLEDRWADPVFVQHMSEAMTAKWQDPEFREKQKQASDEFYATPEAKQYMSEKSKLGWNKPGNKEAHSERMKSAWQDPEVREVWLKDRCAVMQAAWDDEEKKIARVAKGRVTREKNKLAKEAAIAAGEIAPTAKKKRPRSEESKASYAAGVEERRAKRVHQHPLSNPP